MLTSCSDHLVPAEKCSEPTLQSKEREGDGWWSRRNFFQLDSDVTIVSRIRAGFFHCLMQLCGSQTLEKGSVRGASACNHSDSSAEC